MNKNKTDAALPIIYGINNCDTVKKALKWLDAADISYQFYDFKKQAISEELIQQFSSLSDWNQLINKRSTTYRNLPDEVKDNLSNDVATEQVLLQPTLLKRPLLLINDNKQTLQLHLGFKPQAYQAIFEAINTND